MVFFGKTKNTVFSKNAIFRKSGFGREIRNYVDLKVISSTPYPRIKTSIFGLKSDPYAHFLTKRVFPTTLIQRVIKVVKKR